MGNKIVEDWVSVDMMGLLQQIGVIPASRATGSSTARS
jgi:hypothetical protein